MSIRTKIARLIVGKAAGQDFDKAPGFEAFMSMFGGKKKTGEIRWNDWAAQRKEYRGTTFACIRKIAPAVASAPLHLYMPAGNGIRESKKLPIDDDTKAFLLTRPHCKAAMDIVEDIEEITEHPALEIFKRANGAMSKYQLFDRTIVDMCLNGNCYWLPVLNNAGAYPAMITFLSPEKTKPIEKDGIVTGYSYRESFRKPLRKYTLEEIVHFWYPNPHSNSQGFSPVSAGSQWITGEGNIATFQNSTLENMGVPAAIVKLVGRMEPDKFKDFKKEFNAIYGGISNSGKVGFTTGEWDIEKLGQTLQEMGYIEGAKMLREFISNTHGVPISKLTMESSNRAVADVGKTDFQRDTILPNLTMIAEELTESLIPMFPTLQDSGAFYMFNDPVDEDVKTKMLVRRTNRTTGVTTPNEERQEDGREPHETPEADELGPIRAPLPAIGDTPEGQARNAIDGAIGKIRMEVGL
jgi:HK97 family phage portal protein